MRTLQYLFHTTHHTHNVIKQNNLICSSPLLTHLKSNLRFVVFILSIHRSEIIEAISTDVQKHKMIKCTMGVITNADVRVEIIVAPSTYFMVAPFQVSARNLMSIRERD